MGILFAKICILVVAALLPILGYLLVRRSKAKRARLLSAAPASAQAAPAPQAQPQISTGGPPSLGRAFIYILLVLFALAVLGGGGAYLYFQHKASGSGAPKAETAADPCAKCKPLELVVIRMDDKDNYLWSGTCTGDGACDECRVPSCAASDNDVALKNCRCAK